MPARTFEQILKFNPYHDAKGRFASANSAASFTYSPGKSKAHDMAIQRERERQAAAAASAVNTKTRGHLNLMTHNTAVQNTMDECGVTQQEAKDMIKAVSGYTEGYAYAMRNWQQKGDAGTEMTVAEAKEMSDNVEKFIQKSPKWAGGELYRGISVDPNTAKGIVNQAKAGKPMDMKGTSSWSSDRDISEDFTAASLGISTDVTIMFKTPSTKKGASVTHLAAFDQAEVIISKDARWIGKSVKQVYRDYWEITLEEMP